MKPSNKKLAGLLSLIFLLSCYATFSQEAPKNDVSIAINYFIDNNQVPHLLVKTKSKVDGRFKPVGDINIKLFLEKDTAGALIANMTTNGKGEATALIPPSLKDRWKASVKHSFLAVFEGNKKYEPAKADLAMSRAKILLDTSADKKITATVWEMKDASWKPVKGVELKIAIRRLDADLSVNEKPSFTTDSLGQASADFKRDSIPGDAKGNIILVAKVEDNDQYGNLSIEQTVPWGTTYLHENTFNRRTLFATRNKTPLWLLLMAYSIVITVWGILVFLVIGLFRIRKLGQEISSST